MWMEGNDMTINNPLPPFDNDQWKPYGFLHGSYQNHCYTCEKTFMGAEDVNRMLELRPACYEC